MREVQYEPVKFAVIDVQSRGSRCVEVCPREMPQMKFWEAMSGCKCSAETRLSDRGLMHEQIRDISGQCNASSRNGGLISVGK